uniref:Uncharacterized protein n=2 Tax=Kuenenia stuttgartiensis TaxID=174633 RepID=Q1PUW3_KUEST|nr:unknown protein [Candidatus Kuenenia stuttgartiensis]
MAIKYIERYSPNKLGFLWQRLYSVVDVNVETHAMRLYKNIELLTLDKPEPNKHEARNKFQSAPIPLRRERMSFAGEGRVGRIEILNLFRI